MPMASFVSPPHLVDANFGSLDLAMVPHDVQNQVLSTADHLGVCRTSLLRGPLAGRPILLRVSMLAEALAW